MSVCDVCLFVQSVCCTSPPAWPSACTFVYLSICFPSFHLYVCPLFQTFVCQSVCQSVCLFVRSSICPCVRIFLFIPASTSVAFFSYNSVFVNLFFFVKKFCFLFVLSLFTCFINRLRKDTIQHISLLLSCFVYFLFLLTKHRKKILHTYTLQSDKEHAHRALAK